MCRYIKNQVITVATGKVIMIMEWGIRLKEIRQKEGVSKYRLARKVGTSEEYLRRLELGALQPSAEQLDKVLQGLGYRLTIEKVE